VEGGKQYQIERVSGERRNRFVPFPNAEMRWPVNSPIMQNYSPRHCWNLPFRASRATTYETPITARIEAWVGVGLHARITLWWLRVLPRPLPSSFSRPRKTSLDFALACLAGSGYLYGLHFCDASDRIVSTMARIELQRTLKEKIWTIYIKIWNAQLANIISIAIIK